VVGGTQVTQGVNYRAPPTPKCSFQDGGVKCAQPALPLTKHCARHVLHDGAQLLFRPCGAPTLGGQDQCREPVVDLAPETRCIYHTRMPPPTVGQSLKPIDSLDVYRRSRLTLLDDRCRFVRRADASADASSSSPGGGPRPCAAGGGGVAAHQRRRRRRAARQTVVSVVDRVQSPVRVCCLLLRVPIAMSNATTTLIAFPDHLVLLPYGDQNTLSSSWN